MDKRLPSVTKERHIVHSHLRSVHTKQLVAAIFVAATNLPVCTSLQHVSCNFQKLHATVSRFRALLYFLQLVAADLSSSLQISQSDSSVICLGGQIPVPAECV